VLAETLGVVAIVAAMARAWWHGRLQRERPAPTRREHVARVRVEADTTLAQEAIDVMRRRLDEYVAARRAAGVPDEAPLEDTPVDESLPPGAA
jgi:hypothetical protein